MIKSEKKVKELSLLLSKENSILISEAISMLRNEEPFEGAISLLTSLYDKTEDISIKKNIEGFMNDIKDQSVSKEVMIEIRKPYNQSTISMLISSCWQSGLDYSEYSADLADIFLKSDYVTALECLTVIEESAHELSLAKRKEIIKIIEEYPVHASNEKKGLTLELVTILKQG
jgi:predicted DNA-binding protein